MKHRGTFVVAATVGLLTAGALVAPLAQASSQTNACRSTSPNEPVVFVGRYDTYGVWCRQSSPNPAGFSSSTFVSVYEDVTAPTQVPGVGAGAGFSTAGYTAVVNGYYRPLSPYNEVCAGTYTPDTYTCVPLP